jgi:hypothetical protein
VQVLKEGIQYALKEVKFGVKVLVKGASSDSGLPNNLGNASSVVSFIGKSLFRAGD